MAKPTSTTATIAEQGSGSGLALPQAIDSWRLSLRAANRSPATTHTYVDAGERFERFLRESGMPLALTGIRREHIEAFLVGLQDAGSRPLSAGLLDLGRSCIGRDVHVETKAVLWIETTLYGGQTREALSVEGGPTELWSPEAVIEISCIAALRRGDQLGYPTMARW